MDTTTKLDTKAWLRAVGQTTWAEAIERLEAERADDFAKTRRDWWLVLAGTPKGKPRSSGNVVFPIFAAVRERQGLPPCPGAVETPGHPAPAIAPGRWTGHVPMTKTTKAARTPAKSKATKRPVKAGARSIVDHSEQKIA